MLTIHCYSNVITNAIVILDVVVYARELMKLEMKDNKILIAIGLGVSSESLETKDLILGEFSKHPKEHEKKLQLTSKSSEKNNDGKAISQHYSNVNWSGYQSMGK